MLPCDAGIAADLHKWTSRSSSFLAWLALDTNHHLLANTYADTYVVTHKYKCLMQLYYTEHTYIVQGWVLISLFCEIRIWNCFCRPRATFDEIAPQPKQIYKNGAWDNHTSSVACRRVHASFPADSLVEKGCTFTARGCLRFNWLFAICLLVLFIMKSPRVVRNSLLHATQEVGCLANVRLLLYERCKLHTCLAWPLKEEVASIVYEENHMLCSNPIVHVSVCIEFFFIFTWEEVRISGICSL